MNKKIILSLATLVAVVAGITGMAAFEAHVINVTAKIENALQVNTTPIDFGTVFPQEPLDKYVDIALSASFESEDRVDDVEYVIRQKPKCWSETDQEYGRVTEDGLDNYICVQSDTADDYAKLPMLCPFLSKHEVTDEDVENDSDGINAFHGPISDWVLSDTINTQVAGRLAKSENDFLDTWKIDLRVPCFEGQCAQDWDAFVERNNPTANPDDYILPGELEHAIFGCDLWIEVTKISESGDDDDDDDEELGCIDKADVMLVLDRSGSVAAEMPTLQTAAKDFVTALSPASDGVHMGQTSFATTGSLDLGLTFVVADINTAIDSLTAVGRTNLVEGITLASVELATNDRNDTDAPDYMVVITDGAPNEPGDIANAKALAAAAADAARTAGTKIYVVGVGTDTATADYLRDEIANHTGQYYDVADYAGLEAVLADIASCN